MTAWRSMGAHVPPRCNALRWSRFRRISEQSCKLAALVDAVPRQTAQWKPWWSRKGPMLLSLLPKILVGFEAWNCLGHSREARIVSRRPPSPTCTRAPKEAQTHDLEPTEHDTVRNDPAVYWNFQRAWRYPVVAKLGLKLLTWHPLMLFLQVLNDLLHKFIGVQPELRNIRACPHSCPQRYPMRTCWSRSNSDSKRVWLPPP